MTQKKLTPVADSLVSKRAAYLQQQHNNVLFEKNDTDAGILNAQNVVDNPYEAKAIYGNDGPANTTIKAKIRLKSHIGPVDTEAELVELQLNKPKP